MDLLPRVSGVNPNPGEHRQGGGDLPRQTKRDSPDTPGTSKPADATPEAPLDPLLAELDRIRTIDPTLTDSGLHRALKAVRAYAHPPGQPVPELPGTITPPTPGAEPPTPPQAVTGSEADQP
ncbi:MAG: hypothetical protein AAB263_13170 [Planctomycetota bacterium]